MPTPEEGANLLFGIIFADNHMKMIKTGMHSRGMRTTRLLTVSEGGLHPGGEGRHPGGLHPGG